MVGYCELALEHWVKALDALDAALDDKLTPLSKDDKKDVRDNIAKAMAHVGTLTVTSKVPGARVSVDGGDPSPAPARQAPPPRRGPPQARRDARPIASTPRAT